MTFDLDADAGVARAVLARIRCFRFERSTREAQALWDWASDAQTPFRFLQERAPPGTIAAHTTMLAHIEEARLLVRQDDDELHRQAISLLERVRAALLPPATEWADATRLRNRLLDALSIAYSTAGDERTARRVNEAAFGQILPSDEGQLRALVNSERYPGAVARLNNHATRVARTAYLDALGADTAGQLRAQIDLQHAHIAAVVSLEARRSTYSRLLGRATKGRVELEQSTLIPDATRRVSALVDVTAILRQVMRESFRELSVSADLRLVRIGHCGAAVAELAFEDTADSELLAMFARSLLSPQVMRYDSEAADDPSRSIRYGDVCALAGDVAAARASWTRARKRLSRTARREATGAITALDQRLETGARPSRAS